MRRALAFSLVLLACCGGLTAADGVSAFDTSDDAGGAPSLAAPGATSPGPGPVTAVDAGPACVPEDAAVAPVDAALKGVPAKLDVCRVVGPCPAFPAECPSGSQCVSYWGGPADVPSGDLCISERPSPYGDLVEAYTAFSCPPHFRVGFRGSVPPQVTCHRDLLEKQD